MQPKFIAIILITSSCAFHTQRSFLTEMENDDRRFFNASQDFPVMGGDTGRNWNTKKQMLARTPSSQEDTLYNRHEQLLRRELKELESGVSDSAAKQYEKYGPKMKTVSEKIYFLKLTNTEKREYLEAKGYVDEPQNYYTRQEKQLALKNADIVLGMSKKEVTGSWGRPLRVEIAGNPSNENERWVYSFNGATKYIYFESGYVGGWE